MLSKRISLLLTALAFFCLVAPFFLGVVEPVAAQTDTPRPSPTTDPMITPTVTEIPPDPTNTPIPTDTPVPTHTSTATPTPTATATEQAVPPVAPTATTSPPDAGASPGDVRGSIQGMVYEDVTGNGRCINTGVEGEGPIAGIPIEFVSSDEQTIITLTSGSDGSFGLAAAGASYWQVSARPGADWVVTSEQTLSAPISAESLSVTGVNFCVQQASAARVVLPASGAQQVLAWGWLALIGLLFIGLGVMRFWQERRVTA